MKTYLKEAQSLDVPTGGKPTDGIISFVVDDLIKGVEAYANVQVIKELERNYALVKDIAPAGVVQSFLNRITELKQK